MPTSARLHQPNASFFAWVGRGAALVGAAGLLLGLDGCSGSGNGKLFATELVGSDASTTPGPDKANGEMDAGAAADARTDVSVPSEAGPGDCGSGTKTCNAVCVADDDPATGCSAAGCSPCSSLPHAVVGCVGGACGVGSCAADYGDCDQTASGCETNLTNSPSNCGACGSKCASGEVCSAGACQHSCGNGLTTCGGSCANLATDTENCGGCGIKCPGTTTGTPTCKNFQCGIACAQGSHLCNGVCASDQSVSSCGSSCIACPTPFNGTATCNGVSCGTSCNPGSHECGGQCVLNTSVTSCGASCTTCATPANGNATCDGVSCGAACFSGFNFCGGQCVLSSVTACGSACTPCTAAPANAQPICTAMACDFACNPGYTRSGATCIATPMPTLVIAANATGKTTGTFSLPQNQTAWRLDAFGTCPLPNIGTAITSYQHVLISNPTSQTATVSVWTSLAPTQGAKAIDTIIASYTAPPATDTERKACVEGVTDICTERTDPTACLDDMAGLFLSESNAITIPPLGTATVYVAAYFTAGTTTAATFGDFLLSARTESLQ